MSYTRDWDESSPIDHSKNKLWPQYDRYIKVDISDRLKDILSGFISGETAVGIKLGKFLTVGTEAPTAPSGTGSAVDFIFYLKQVGSNSYGDIYFRNNIGSEARLTMIDKLCLDNARLSNDTWLVGSNSAGEAQNILKVNTGNQVECASHFYAPDTSPAADLQLAPKGYIDPKFDTSSGHDHNGTNSKKISGQLGSWVNKSSDYGAQQAATDGFVIVHAYNTANNQLTVIVYTDSNSDPTTIRARFSVSKPGDGYDPMYYGNFIMPVRKSDYWKVTRTAAPNQSWAVYWIPLGS